MNGRVQSVGCRHHRNLLPHHVRLHCHCSWPGQIFLPTIGFSPDLNFYFFLCVLDGQIDYAGYLWCHHCTFSYIDVLAALVIIEVIPFLVLVAGVDNIFILVQTYQETPPCQWDGTHWPYRRWSVTPSVLLLSSISEVFCFFVGKIVYLIYIIDQSITPCFIRIGSLSGMRTIRRYGSASWIFAPDDVFCRTVLSRHTDIREV